MSDRDMLSPQALVLECEQEDAGRGCTRHDGAASQRRLRQQVEERVSGNCENPT
jgi:hypothetical protein